MKIDAFFEMMGNAPITAAVILAAFSIWIGFQAALLKMLSGGKSAGGTHGIAISLGLALTITLIGAISIGGSYFYKLPLEAVGLVAQSVVLMCAWKCNPIRAGLSAIVHNFASALSAILLVVVVGQSLSIELGDKIWSAAIDQNQSTNARTSIQRISKPAFQPGAVQVNSF